MKKNLCLTLFGIANLFLLCFGAWASEGDLTAELSEARQVAQYNYVIHILAMLLVGFGFLMVFVRRYGFGATTGTYLVVAVGLPFYMLLRANGVFAHEIAPNTVKALLFAEFAVATALIAMGAVLGRLRVFQYALLALLLVPAYLMNEWLVLDNGMGLTEGYQDTAGSVIIHAFGAYFGLGSSLALTTSRQRMQAIESDATSDRFAMLGSMVLWLFWPSFATAIVPFEEMPQTVVNTVLALCGATIGTYFLSTYFHKGKTSMVDMANAALAGGVAIGQHAILSHRQVLLQSVCWPAVSASSVTYSYNPRWKLASKSWIPAASIICTACLVYWVRLLRCLSYPASQWLNSSASCSA